MAGTIIYRLDTNYMVETRLLLRLRSSMRLHRESERPLIVTGNHKVRYRGELQNLVGERQVLKGCNANDRNPVGDSTRLQSDHQLDLPRSD